MIDISNVVLRIVRESLNEDYPDIEITSTNPDSVSELPLVSVVEFDNYTLSKTLDARGVERHANVVYDINVYTNNIDGKKQEAKKIINLIDNALIGYNFTRMSKSEIPNKDRGIYRIYGRYKAIVSKDIIKANGDVVNEIYRR